MTHTRVTPASGLRSREIVRIGGLPVVVEDIAAGSITYKGRTFEVVYLTGRTAAGVLKTALVGDPNLVAAS
jgi:hypothetical protein